MVLFTYRPEYSQPWGSRSYHNQINLNRLSNRESLVMVSPLLGTEDVDPRLQKLIVTKTEGVPFFIEEFVKSLQDLKAIRKEDGRVCLEGDLESSAVPSTIQDMIMARVDRLPDPAKAVLQAGSVIEREFTHELIRKITGFPEQELLTYLSSLKDAELLYERGVYPQTSYIFRHALTREVVYNSILTQRRKELHAEIGGTIETFCKDDLSEYYEVLSEHFFKSENYLKAAEYSKSSARKAEKSASLPDAIIHARRRVFCLEKSLESRVPGKELIDARTSLGLYLAEIDYLVEAREAVGPVVQLARDKSYGRRLGQIQSIIGHCHHAVDEDFQKAIDTCGEGLRIAEAEKDIITLVFASYWIGCAQGWSCDFEKSRESIQRALDINIMANNLWGIAMMKASLAYYYCFLTGRIDSLTALASEALEVAQESGDSMSKGICHTVFGLSCYARGHFEDSVRHLLEGKRLCEQLRLNLWVASACYPLAETYWEMKEFQRSKNYFDQGNKALERVQLSPSIVRWGQLGMAKCDAMLGERDLDLQAMRAIPNMNRVKIMEGLTFAYLGEIFRNLGDCHVREVEHWVSMAIEANRRNGSNFHLGLNHALYADYFKLQGERNNAQMNLGKAIDILKKCGADGWVEKYEKELASL